MVFVESPNEFSLFLCISKLVLIFHAQILGKSIDNLGSSFVQFFMVCALHFETLQVFLTNSENLHTWLM